MIVKHHTTHDGKSILAICDSGLLGKVYEEGELQLDLTSDFYKGEEMSEDETLKEISKVNSLNIVGQKSVDFAIKHELIEESHVKKIANIPYAICIFVEMKE